MEDVFNLFWLKTKKDRTKAKIYIIELSYISNITYVN